MNNAVLIIAVPLLTAFTIPVLGAIMPRISKLLTLSAVAFEGAFAGWLLSKSVHHPFAVIIGGWKPPFGINLYVDVLSSVIALVASVVMFFAVLHQLSSGKVKPPSFYMLVLLLLTGVMGITFTGDLFNLFVFLEISGIAAYSLIASGNGGLGVRGSVKYIILGSVVSVAYLIGIALFYSAAGTLNMADAASKFALLKPSLAVFVAIAFLSAILLESEIFPFNAWVPDAYRGAPSSVSAMLSGSLALASAYVLLRFNTLLFSNGHGGFVKLAGGFKLGHALFGLGVITVVVGEIAALAQSDAKKMLAYSSVGQMGLVLMAFSLGTDKAIYGGVFALISHSISKLLLFIIVGLIISKLHTAEWKKWRGIARKSPLLGALFIIGALGVIGVPLFAGFWGKFAIVGGALEHGIVGRMGIYVLLAASVVESGYFFRLAHALFEEPEGEEPEKVKGNVVFWVSSLILASFIVLLGVWPSIADRYVKKVPGQLLGQSETSYVTVMNRTMER